MRIVSQKFFRVKSSFTIHPAIHGLFTTLILLSPGFSQWTPVSGNLGTVYSLVNSPWGELYAGTANDAFRLEDEVGWIRVDSGFPEEGVVVYDLAVKEEYLFAATDAGVYRHSGGDGWVATMDSGVRTLMVKDSALFAGRGGVFRSYDNGNTWTEVNNGLTNLQINALAVMGSMLFTATGGKLIFRSDDDGDTWTRINYEFEFSRSSLGVMGSRLYAGGGGGVIYRSDDSGRTWVDMDVGLFSISIIPFEQTLFAAGGGGASNVVFSPDSGDTWHDWSEGIRDNNREVNSLLVHDGYLLAGAGYQFCGPNSCDPPQGRIWQRPLSEVVSIGDEPFAHFPAASGLKVLRGSGGGIEFTLSQKGWAELSLYSPGGKLVATLAQGDYKAGSHRVSLGAGELPGGLYLARLKAPGVSHAQKILLE